jgi:DNA-binding response OmpR family regulator
MAAMSARARILVVEDEPRLAEILRLYLERDGHRVTVVGDGRAAIEVVDRDPVDLVVLDLMLPGVSGEAVLGAVRERGNTPVLIASAKRSDLERISGLRMGADDYLAKPFNPHELTARVAAVLRRSAGPGTTTAVGAIGATESELSFEAGRLVVDTASRRYTRRLAPGEAGGSASRGRLTPGELGLLAALARRPGSVLTRDQLLEAVTRRPDEVYDRVIDVHVANLRRKLGDDAARPWLIETIPQTGYRLVASRDPAPA